MFSLALAGSAFAAVENIRVSGDINIEGVTRGLDAGSELPGTQDQEDFIFSQVRLRFDADLTENVAATIGIINERLWGQDAATTVYTVTDSIGNIHLDSRTENTAELDLDLAYIELQEFLYEPVTVIVGRQNLRYGNGLIIGDPDTNMTASTGVPAAIGDLSLRKSFDAARVIFDYAPFTFEGFYAKIDEGLGQPLGAPVTLNTNVDDDITILGANLTYEWDSYNGVTEVYAVSVDNAPGINFEPTAASDVITLGGRTQLDLNDNWTIGAEGAIQFGSSIISTGPTITADLEAMAGQIMAEYRFLNDYDAKIGACYTYLSGDEDGTDDEFNNWNPLFEDQSPGEILNLAGINSNLWYLSFNGSMICPGQEDITLGLSYTYAMLAEKLPSALTQYSPGLGPIAGNVYAVNTEERDIGTELDFWATYDYTEDVQLKFLGAIFFPQEFFASTNEDNAYLIRGGMTVEF
ncbi:MAG: alginate export family protein [Candidatus Omnitrophota bacterium]|nr:MAG: alginate export family protein [Candidatus Omnitrophota bacterium]